GGVEDRRMIEAGGAGRRWVAAFALPGVEPDVVVIAASRDEGSAWPAGGHGEAEHAAIEVERPLQIGHLQVHMADAHPGVDGRKGQLLLRRFLGHFAGFRHVFGPWRLFAAGWASIRY